MGRLLIVVAIVIAALYVGICLILFFSQRYLIYFPTQASQTPTEALKVSDATLRLSARQRGGPRALIYFGGNAEDVSLSLEAFAETFPDHAIYMLHYRGYGGSTGRPSEPALHSDAQALFEMVHARHPEVVVVGRSLGSGVAVRLAAGNPVDRLILVTPFDSITNLARRQFPFFPVNLLLQDRFESWRYAPGITSPTLIVMAENDEVVPRERTTALLEAFSPGVASLKIIPGAGHNSISSSPAYMQAVSEPE